MNPLLSLLLEGLLIVGACFAFWIWKVVSVGGTLADGLWVGFTWAVPALVILLVLRRDAFRGK